MPEPLINESTTDIDRPESGELEFDLTASGRRASAKEPELLTGSVEVEWGVTRLLGLALEAGLTRAIGQDSAAVETEPSIRVAAAWALLHDFAKDIHFQAEAAAHVVGGGGNRTNTVEPGESAVPVTFDVRGGLRRQRWTLRPALGVGIGAGSRHVVPIRASVGLFGELRPSAPLGFVGLEVAADWARRNPLSIAPTVVLGTPLIRVGLALFLNTAAGDPPPALILRAIFEPD